MTKNLPRKTVLFKMELEKLKKDGTDESDTKSDKNLDNPLEIIKARKRQLRAQSKIMQKFDRTNAYGLTEK